MARAKKSPKRAQTMSATLRQEILSQGLSLYRISKESGVSYPALHRFVVHEQAIAMPALDKLCGYLGLRLMPTDREKAARQEQPRREHKR